MTRPHDELKLARMRSDLATRMGALSGVSDSRVAAQQNAAAAYAEAVRVAGIRFLDTRRPVGDLLETLQADYQALSDDSRKVDTVRKIAAAMVHARAAVAAREHADRMAVNEAAMQRDLAPLAQLVNRCDAWLKEEA